MALQISGYIGSCRLTLQISGCIIIVLTKGGAEMDKGLEKKDSWITVGHGLYPITFGIRKR